MSKQIPQPPSDSGSVPPQNVILVEQEGSCYRVDKGDGHWCAQRRLSLLAPDGHKMDNEPLTGDPVCSSKANCLGRTEADKGRKQRSCQARGPRLPLEFFTPVHHLFGRMLIAAVQFAY